MSDVKQGRIEPTDYIWSHVHPKNEIAEKLAAFAEATGTKLPVAVQSRIRKAEEATARYERSRELHQEALDRKRQLERSMSEEEVNAALDTDPENWRAPEVPSVPDANRRMQVYEKAVLTRTADLVAEIDYDSFYKTLTKAWDSVVEFPRPPSMTLKELGEKEAQVAEARQAILDLHRAIVHAKFSGPHHLIREFREIPELVDAREWWWDKTQRPAAERAAALRAQKEREEAARAQRRGEASEVAQFRTGEHPAQESSGDVTELEAASA